MRSARMSRQPAASLADQVAHLDPRRARSVAPSGRPQIARIWFSNCEVSAPSIVQWPLLWTRGAISLNSGLVADREEFQRQHADIVERLGDAPRQRLGGGDGRRRAPAPAGTVERSRMPRLVDVARRSPRARPRRPPPRQSRIENSASNAIEASSTQGAPRTAFHAASASPAADPHLALAVIAEAAASSGSPACRARRAPRRASARSPTAAKAPGGRRALTTNAFSVSRSWAISSASRGGRTGTCPVERGERAGRDILELVGGDVDLARRSGASAASSSKPPRVKRGGDLGGGRRRRRARRYGSDSRAARPPWPASARAGRRRRCRWWSRAERSFGTCRDAVGLLRAPGLEPRGERFVRGGEDRGGEQAGIDRAGLADRQRRRPECRRASGRSRAGCRGRTAPSIRPARRAPAAGSSTPSCRAGGRRRRRRR